MTLLPRFRRRQVCATALLGGAGEEEFHDFEAHGVAAFEGEFGLAEAGVDHVDCDGGVGVVFGGVGGEGTDVEDFEEFGDLVAVGFFWLVWLWEWMDGWTEFYGRDVGGGKWEMGNAYRSSILAVFSSFNAAKISSLLFSGNCVMKCTSLVTVVKHGLVPNFAAVSRNFGNIISASRNVLTTFVVMVLSLSSVNLNTGVAIPAFSSRMSSRGSDSARLANALTES